MALGGNTAAESYLDVGKILAAAKAEGIALPEATEVGEAPGPFGRDVRGGFGRGRVHGRGVVGHSADARWGSERPAVPFGPPRFRRSRMEAVIVATARTPIGRANKGSLVDVRPDDPRLFLR